MLCTNDVTSDGNLTSFVQSRNHVKTKHFWNFLASLNGFLQWIHSTYYLVLRLLQTFQGRRNGFSLLFNLINFFY